jgi:hypothetical protein
MFNIVSILCVAFALLIVSDAMLLQYGYKFYYCKDSILYFMCIVECKWCNVVIT